VRWFGVAVCGVTNFAMTEAHTLLLHTTEPSRITKLTYSVYPPFFYSKNFDRFPSV